MVRIGLGTVQFGLNYGISNNSGKTPKSEVRRILDLAGRRRIRILDTASQYGQSEEIIGQSLPDSHSFSIVTKTPSFGNSRAVRDNADHLEATFSQSLLRLGQQNIYGLLIHRAEDLLQEGGEHLFEKLCSLKERRLIKKIGVSVYDAHEIDALLGKYHLDLLQVPVSILDQRLIESGHLASLKRDGVEIHARSVFLQGLLLMQPSSLPAHFDGVRSLLRTYFETAASQGLSPLQVALGFVTALPNVDTVICGVNNCDQLADILNASTTSIEASGYSRFAVSDEAILNPSLWKW